MMTEQEQKYRQIYKEALDQVEVSHQELLLLAHQQKVAYRVARLYAYRLQESLKRTKPHGNGN